MAPQRLPLRRGRRAAKQPSPVGGQQGGGLDRCLVASGGGSPRAAPIILARCRQTKPAFSFTSRHAEDRQPDRFGFRAEIGRPGHGGVRDRRAMFRRRNELREALATAQLACVARCSQGLPAAFAVPACAGVLCRSSQVRTPASPSFVSRERSGAMAAAPLVRDDAFKPASG